MSMKLILNVIKQCKHKPSEKLMLTVLAEFANDTGRCYPSFGTLAGLCNVSTRQAQNIIYKLIADGDISASHREGGSNVYQFLRYMQPITHETDCMTPPTKFVTNAVEETIITHETHFVTPPTQFLATHEMDFVPPTQFLSPTHETHFVPPTKPTSSEPVIEPNTEPKDKNIKSIVAPDGDDTTQKSLPPTPTHPSEGKESDVPRVVASSTIEGMPSSQSSPQAESVPVSNSQIQPPPVAPPRDMRPLSDQQLMMSAIVAAFGWNFKTMTTGNKSLVGKIAKELLDATATPDQIPDLYAFCKSKNWSGGFTPGALSSQWANFCANQDSSGEIFPDWTPPPGYVGVKFNYPPPLAETIADDENDPYIGLTTAEMREKFNQIMAKMVANMTIEETPIPDDDPLKEVLLW